MFKPRVYKSNGLEAYRLINDEGGDFLYEGSVEYSEEELFKDGQGRTFFLVTTEIGGPNKYYIEVEAEGRPIPAPGVKKDKDIAGLVNASPRGQALPEVQAPEPELPGPAPPERDTCFEGPEKAPEPAQEPPAAPAPQLTTAEEAQAAVKAMASLGERRPPKKSNIFSLPVILALIFIILIIAAAGILIFKPGLVSGLSLPFTLQPTPAPAPEVTATPIPPTATPQPAPEANPGSYTDLVDRLLPLVAALNSNNTSAMAFASDTANSTGTKLAMVCDLYDSVNEKWGLTDYNGTPQAVNVSIETMKGSLADYSVLMAALAEAEGMDSRVAVVYNESERKYVYYPEVKVATNASGYSDAAAYLLARYGVQGPYHQADGNDYWLSLSIGKSPGIYVDSRYGYTINSRSEVRPV